MIITIHSLNNAPGKRETIKPGNKTRVFGTVLRGLKVDSPDSGCLEREITCCLACHFKLALH